MMSTDISTNYRKLEDAEIEAVAKQCELAWQDPDIPMRQFELAAKNELKSFSHGGKCVPFDALVRCLRTVMFRPNVSLLDVGASGGYYREVLEIAGYDFRYTGCDYSPAFKALAEKLYPGIAYDVADARALPYADESFGIVLSGCVMLHVFDFQSVIRETARVAGTYAMFNKTPVHQGPTECYEKEAYGVKCIEWKFNADELLGLFWKNGLNVIHTEDAGVGHITYMLKKQPELVHYPV